MTRTLLALAVVLALVAVVDAAPAAPPLRVKVLDTGRTIDSRDLLGKKIIVVRFQSSYCKPCVRESAALSRLAERYARRGVEVIALHVQDTATDVRRFLRAQKPAYAVALDPKLAIGNRFGFKGAPYTVVIDKRGEMVVRLSGEGAIGKLPRLLDDLLGK